MNECVRMHNERHVLTLVMFYYVIAILVSVEP